MCALFAKAEPEDAARRRKLVISVLEDVRDQRAKLRLEFDEGVTSLHDVTATLVDFDASGLTLEASALKGASGTWIGGGVRCSFRIRDREARGREQFLTFDTRIAGTQQRPSGMVHLLLDLPETVKSAQMRRSVRVQVDKRKVPALKLWRELPSGTLVGGIDPLFDTEADLKLGFKVDNFSANGMRLAVAGALLRERWPEQHKGERFSFHFQALAEAGSPAASFWVNGVLRNVFHDTQKGETFLGFEFTAEGFLEDGRRLSWRPLKFDEVSGLGKFVFKWNLDLYREKGIGGS